MMNQARPIVLCKELREENTDAIWYSYTEEEAT